MADMPKVAGPEAEEMGLMIDGLVEDLLNECGLPRVNRTGSTAKVLGLMVQYAIDKHMERLSSERMDG